MTTTPNHTDRPIQVFIVEDHPIVRHGIKQLLNDESDMVVRGEAERLNEALDKLQTLRPDVILVDLSLDSGDSGLDLIQRVRAQWVGLKMIVISTYDAAVYAPQCMQAGAMGYINKHEAVDQIVDAVRSVCNGNVFLPADIGAQSADWFG